MISRDVLIVLKRGLGPIVDDDARVLILGTLPGDESLRRGEYYGHPRNHFWPLLATVFEEEITATYSERLSFLARNRLAVWDVLYSAERAGSLDSAIKRGRSNNFAALFRDYPNLRTIAFNGQKAHALYRSHVSKLRNVPHDKISLIVLPSTSPTHVRPLDEKVAAWKGALRSR